MSGPGEGLSDHVLGVTVGAGDHVRGAQLAHAAGGGRAGVDSCLHRSDIPAISA